MACCCCLAVGWSLCIHRASQPGFSLLQKALLLAKTCPRSYARAGLFRFASFGLLKFSCCWFGLLCGPVGWFHGTSCAAQFQPSQLHFLERVTRPAPGQVTLRPASLGVLSKKPHCTHELCRIAQRAVRTACPRSPHAPSCERGRNPAPVLAAWPAAHTPGVDTVYLACLTQHRLITAYGCNAGVSVLIFSVRKQESKPF